jgi:mRNA interferase MazF
MNLRRGDIVLAFYPFAAGTGGSRRPVLVIQSDVYNQQLSNAIVAQITTNLARANEPAHLLIERSSPEGQQSGLLHDSVISCLNLATLTEDRLDVTIGSLPDAAMARISDCLKTALAIR